jgi:LysM repeat protein
VWLIAALCVVACGCMPSSEGPADEQKESFFRMGKARANALDQKGAIEAFEKAIDVNPQNGAAHFELGLLCEKELDFSAAIYHFERFLKLRPDSELAQTVQAMIMADKMELSKAVASTPVNQSEMAKLTAENKRLQGEIDRLNAQIAQAAAQGQAPNPIRQGESSGLMPPRTGGGSGGAGVSESPRQGSGGAGNIVRPMRTHIVKAGDTPVSIARQHGVKLDALMASNRGLDPRRMKVGQTVTIPPR